MSKLDPKQNPITLELKRLFDRSKLSYGQIAANCDLPKRTCYRILNSEVHPQLDTVGKIAKTLGRKLKLGYLTKSA